MSIFPGPWIHPPTFYITHIPQFDTRLLRIFCIGHEVVVLCAKNMSCPAFLVSIVKLCSLFRVPSRFLQSGKLLNVGYQVDVWIEKNISHY